MKMSEPLRLCFWSGPRNVSTAVTYSFRQREDTRVIDEPLYGHYLKVSQASHPAQAELVQKLDCDGERVVQEVILGPCDRPVLFMKQMAHHLESLRWDFLSRTCNVLFIRDPRQMLPSLVNQVRQPVLRDTGLAMQTRLLKHLRSLGQDPPVMDSKELLIDPKGVLQQLCDRIGIEFTEAMLEWSSGPKPEDGPWAPYWYHNAHRSTGFMPYQEKTQPFPNDLEPLLGQCCPHYELLYSEAIKICHGSQ